MAINTIHAYMKMRRLLRERIESLKGPLFTTDAEDLWGLYLRGLDADRQAYNCMTCAAFIRKYGDLATINRQGELESALWNADYPTFFRLSTETMRERVVGSRVTGVYVNDRSDWGTATVNGWLHLHGRTLSMSVVADARRVRNVLSREYKLLHYNFSQCDRDAVIRAIGRSIGILRASMFDSEEVKGSIKWLLSMQQVIRIHNDNLLWRSVATAPRMHCQMILALLGDINVLPK